MTHLHWGAAIAYYGIVLIAITLACIAAFVREDRPRRREDRHG